jgi:hypothetical protein
VTGYWLVPGEPFGPETLDVSDGGARQFSRQFPPDFLLVRPRFVAKRTQEFLTEWRSREEVIDSCVTDVFSHEESGPAAPFFSVIEDCATSHWVQHHALRSNEKLSIGPQ